MKSWTFILFLWIITQHLFISQLVPVLANGTGFRLAGCFTLHPLFPELIHEAVFGNHKDSPGVCPLNAGGAERGRPRVHAAGRSGWPWNV